ncbi:MAG: hypothetical protein QGI83_00415 [Candidatus Latescibacteria bacterium]|nr:hypothetical protein [Candidatus Latescibacterota bacterium]
MDSLLGRDDDRRKERRVVVSLPVRIPDRVGDSHGPWRRRT